MTEVDVGAFYEKLADSEMYLEHFGVKGMKWGVRKDRSGGIRARATLGFRDRRAAAWQATAENRAYSKVYRRAAGKIRRGTRELNADPKFADQDFRTDSPLRREYYNAYSKMVTGHLNDTVSSRSMVLPWRRLGMSPNKRLELNFTYDVSKEVAPKVTIRRTETRAGQKANREARSVKHADDELDLDAELEVFLILDDMGHIEDLDVPMFEDEEDDDLTHTTLAEAQEFLEHSGFKGIIRS